MLIKRLCLVFYLSLKMIVVSHLFATTRAASPQKETRAFLFSLRKQQIFTSILWIFVASILIRILSRVTYEKWKDYFTMNLDECFFSMSEKFYFQKISCWDRSFRIKKKKSAFCFWWTTAIMQFFSCVFCWALLARQEEIFQWLLFYLSSFESKS